ncbi:MAG: serine/threonine protein kinase, partial [Deltaproteobacteria bacterium]|nr:serine/threonine protein kinase [Nannocystaceae bacterium]
MPAVSSDEPRDESRTDLLTTSETSLSFGKYRLTRLLARGGMGEVYLARLVGELGFEKRLVIKTILPHLAANARFVELFAAEAKTAVALSHGNIVPIYELGRTGDIFYIVMGHVDGPSVSTMLDAYHAQERAPELGCALHIVRGVLTGLAYAHTPEPGRHAVVHRDITPRNVLVDRSGQVRIVDFGIAAPADAEVEMRGGSTGYASPEQIRGGTVDPRADVFSTACLLYELVTLERAFPKEGVWIAPDMRGVPDELRGPLEDALALEPAGRPRDAHALLERLQPAFARHAASFGDGQLAAHLRALFPDGWETQSQPAVAGKAAKGERGNRPQTHTFATRLTLITQSLPNEPAIARSPAHGRRALVLALALASIVVLAVGAWWLATRTGDD